MKACPFAVSRFKNDCAQYMLHDLIYIYAKIFINPYEVYIN